jgi:hypothetical protein
MPYLIAAAAVPSPVSPEQFAPAIWRQVRQFNLPVQLALAAAEEVIVHAARPEEIGVISVAPNEPGSYELNAWIKQVHARRPEAGALLRMKPTHTLHMVDNLALSSFAISHGNHAECLGLGGAPGQVWVALEVLLEWFAADRVTEALLITGDQTDAKQRDIAGLGVAWLFAREPRPDQRSQRLAGVDRASAPDRRASVCAEAARGLMQLANALSVAPAGDFRYAVPDDRTDGMDRIGLRWEIGP